ncbi:hypothetical protein IMG5_009770 [Ichthyophthirius multifiliis]|uniref:Uncharacterized protein n=1 Tax=Ichthyophthirius multifiliis TaxID=5932 RepID=G0QJW3_ICHMU|nr:hypothetical protein IMG5_009770 [Ichthyophthirius multifiliis]EGR34491.1 hypothetical protein IMG5_009770 [Ichthyophthirius multifiliis]|eukprot:XP_004039795.1 hypothetical protein IMG5_009770 [Ichthyophthirius multifiliis]
MNEEQQFYLKNKESSTDKKEKLEQLKQNLKQNKSEVSPLVQICTTLDQATALLHILDSLKEKNNFTLSLTASRGRGKSSLLGLAAAYCIQNGYSNIYITSPCVFNVSSFFNFLLKGIDQYSWVENVDYEIMQSCEKDLGREIIQINFKKNHRQTIQFVLPGDLGLLKNQWDVLFIDEAAAIPLPVLKKGLKNKNMNNFVILSSTINGYEGTGRSLSLKLITELKKGEKIKEITLEQPIRYNQNDVIEHWLNEVMLLEACNEVPLKKGLVHPNEQKNSKDFPDVLCAVQVALEGGISEKEILIKQEKSSKPNGDLVPWVLQEQFLDNQFPQGLGVRIVRIASHPSACRMGYGSKCLELLTRFFQGEIISLDENESTTKFDVFGENQGQIQRLLGKLTEANIPKEEQEEGQNKIAVLPKIMDKEAFEKYLNAYDMKRIEAYVKSLADFDLIKDLLSVLYCLIMPF